MNESYDYSQLNFSALDEKVSHKYTGKEMWNDLDPTEKRAAFIAAGIFVGALFMSGGALVASQGFFLMLLPIIVMLTITIIVTRYAIKNRAKLQRFANDNDLYYSANKSTPPYKPIMFNIGHTKNLLNTLVFPNDSVLSEYQYVTGSGKSRTTHRFTFMQVKLSRKVPHLILDSKSMKTPAPPAGAYHIQTIKLEGDFHKYFTLYVPKDYQVDALQIFTPDVMNELMEYGKDLDLEFIDNELYIYHRGNVFKNAAKTREFLIAVSKITDRINRQIKNYRDARIGNVASDVVHLSGARLKGRGVWGYHSTAGVSKRDIIIIAIAFAAFVIYVVVSVILTTMPKEYKPITLPPAQPQQTPTSPIDICYKNYEYHKNQFVLQECLDRYDY